jgi:hypothetical protein
MRLTKMLESPAAIPEEQKINIYIGSVLERENTNEWRCKRAPVPASGI